MTIAEFYSSIGSDVGPVLSRLSNEKLVKRLLGKYPADKNYGLLEEGMAKKDYDQAFNAAHTIKGVASNLGFDELQAAASEMSEAFKKKQYDGLEEMFARVSKAHQSILSGIEQTELD